MQEMVFNSSLYFDETSANPRRSKHSKLYRNELAIDNKTSVNRFLRKNNSNVIVYLAKLAKYCSNNLISSEEKRKTIHNALFKIFKSKEEGFLWFALECIEQNSSLSIKLKEQLKIEMTRKIQEYGKYYDETLILESLIQYAKVPFEYHSEYLKSRFRFQGKHGLIIYKTTSTRCAKILNHELCHAELFFRNTLPFYDESRAGLLSERGYGKARALFGLLSLLGDEEVILKCLINNNIEQMWNNILTNNPHALQMIYKIRNVLESIPRSNMINEVLDKNVEIVNMIRIIYEMKNGCSCMINPKFELFSIVYQINRIYEINDIRTNHGQIPISIQYNFLNFEQKNIFDLFQKNQKNSPNELKFRLIQKYLGGELQIVENNSHIPYEVTASYFIELALGKSFFQQLLRAENPYIMLDIINYQLSKDLRLRLTLEDFNTLIDYANKGKANIGVAKTNFGKIIRRLNQNFQRMRA